MQPTISVLGFKVQGLGNGKKWKRYILGDYIHTDYYRDAFPSCLVSNQ